MKPSEFRITAIVNAIAAESWQRVASDERREHERLSRLAGAEPAGAGAARIPGYALRDLNLTTGSGLAGTVTTGDQYIAALSEESVALRLGARVLPVSGQTSTLAVPVGSAPSTAYWLATETTQVTPAAPTLESSVAVPKLLAAFCGISRHLLLQAGDQAERVVREELRRAAASALDAALFAGAGTSGEPQGIVGSADTGAFTGASLDASALRNAQYDLANAKAITDPTKLAYVTTPAVAETLAKRARVASSDRMLWEGGSHSGVVEGLPALASASMPAGTMILGDWSSAWIIEFAGGLVIEADPFSAFASGVVNLRLLVPCDVLLARPAAFTIAESIT